MVDLGQGISDDLAGARPNDCSGARWLSGNGTEREEHGESVSGLTGAWAVAWQPRDGGEEVVVEAIGAHGTWAW
jgi:hypothetical protein